MRLGVDANGKLVSRDRLAGQIDYALAFSARWHPRTYSAAAAVCSEIHKVGIRQSSAVTTPFSHCCCVWCTCTSRPVAPCCCTAVRLTRPHPSLPFLSTTPQQLHSRQACRHLRFWTGLNCTNKRQSHVRVLEPQLRDLRGHRQGGPTTAAPGVKAMAMGTEQLPLRVEDCDGDAQDRAHLHPATFEDAARKSGGSRDRTVSRGRGQETAERPQQETIVCVFQAPGP